MKIPKPYECYLEVLAGGKGIPYGGGQRPDGDVNHGFHSLKGSVTDVSKVPEVADDPALATFLRTVNEDDTAFFTVGCVSGKVQDEQGHRMSGYVEFSINDRGLVGDAMNYFQVFWHYTQAINSGSFSERVVMHWQLLAATFIDADCHGMTCAIVVNTHYHSTAEEAYGCWQNTLESIASAMVKRRGMRLDRIY